MGANRVILNDIDYNPYIQINIEIYLILKKFLFFKRHNDKQAEDRSHRLGQKK